MGLESLDIILDNRHRSYFAGHTVSGKVIVKLVEKPKKIQGIKLKLVGKAKTHWKEAGGRTTLSFEDEEMYMDEKVYLFGYESNGEDVNLQPGEHEYRFHFKLPTSLPSSFEHKYGYVKYFLEAVVSRSLKSNISSKLPFTVNGILDLNNQWDAKHEGELRKQKNVCCLFCTSGPLGFFLKLPRIGFVPGESVPFDAELFNYSRRNVRNITVSLIQEIKFYAAQRTKKKIIPMSAVEGPRLHPGEAHNWTQTWLPIPAIPPSKLGGCRIIDVNYFVKMKMEVKDAVTLKGLIPVIVGTIPLRMTFSELMPAVVVTVEDGIVSVPPSESPQPIPLISDYPDLPPPTYEEALRCGEPYEEDSETEPPEYDRATEKGKSTGNYVFVPRYVTYGSRSQDTSPSPNAASKLSDTSKS